MNTTRSKWGRVFTVPNVITVFRTGLGLSIVPASFSQPASVTVAIAATFCIAAALDKLDGFLAWLLDQRSKLGAFLDPAADTVINTSATIVLLTFGTWEPEQLLIVAVIFLREIVTGTLRRWNYLLAPKSKINKYKVAVYFVTFGVALFAISSDLSEWVPHTWRASLLMEWAYWLTFASGLAMVVATMRDVAAEYKTQQKEHRSKEVLKPLAETTT